MLIGDLLFHQIAKHHFFQGKESKYRVEPEKLIKLFNIQSGKDYSTDTFTKSVWCFSGGSFCVNDTDKKNPLDNWVIKNVDISKYKHEQYDQKMTYKNIYKSQ
mgnify:CR=1 FL=1|jgi:hypothetical protein